MESQVDRNKLSTQNEYTKCDRYCEHNAQKTELEKQAPGRAFGDTDTLVESMKFGFDLQMYMKVSDDEHVKQLQVLECSSKDVIRGYHGAFSREIAIRFFLRQSTYGNIE